MRRHLVLLIALPAVAWPLAPAARADSWLFRPSTFSHDPTTGDRVTQYARNEPSYAREDPTYLESGYRHRRLGIRAGGSADRLHIVQTWGAGEAIRPYGEWLFPFRAGATPYGPWGNPQGPWTMPFDSWVNPYGSWNRYYPPYWGPYDGDGGLPPRGGGGGHPPQSGHGRGTTPHPGVPQGPPHSHSAQP